MLVAPPPAVTVPADYALTALVAAGRGHAMAAYSSVFAMAFDAIPVIELPPGAEARVDTARMRALAALYLAADLEPAGVLRAAEDLAALAASGGLRVDLGPVSGDLHRFWRTRSDRASAEERLAFYGRLFGPSYGAQDIGGPVNRSFEPLMLALCEALYQIGDTPSSSAHGSIAGQTRIRAAARNLLGNLVQAGGGATPFMAQDVLNALKSALDILKEPHLQGIFGARDIWGVVRGIEQLSQRGGYSDPRAFVDRGKAGMTLILWLSDVAPRLRQYGNPLLQRDDPVIPAAIDWLQATLTISELQSAQAAPPPGPSADGVSDWADLGI